MGRERTDEPFERPIDPRATSVVTRREALLRTFSACALIRLPHLGMASGISRGPACKDLRGATIRFLVGYSPGGGYDTYARLLEPVVERQLGAKIVVRNLPGAAGMVAARTLANATPDGRTLGILDGPGLLLAHRRRLQQAPDLEADLAPLARVARLHPLLVTSKRSGLHNVDQVLARARSGPLVAGITGTFSQNFVNCSVTAKLLGFEARFVAGFPGSREIMLALMRGDVDFAAADVESVRGHVESGQLSPILQIARAPYDLVELPNGVPHLAGSEGIVTRRPDLFLSGVPGLRESAEALVSFTSLGRLLVAPAGLSDERRYCLEDTLSRSLGSPEFRASAERAHRSLDTASAAEVERELAVASEAIKVLLPIVEQAESRTL